MGKRSELPILDRLAANSEWRDDCLVWLGYRNDFGYGRINVAGRLWIVHRLAWTELRGEPPTATPHVLHHCDNPPCWNIDHLWLGTQSDNMQDCSGKGRWSGGHGRETRCPAGHPYNEANTYIEPNRRHRVCRICRRENARRSRSRTLMPIMSTYGTPDVVRPTRP